MTERQGVEIDYLSQVPRRFGWIGGTRQTKCISRPSDDSRITRGDTPRPARTTHERERYESEFRSEREYRPEVERPYPSDRDRYEQRPP